MSESELIKDFILKIRQATGTTTEKLQLSEPQLNDSAKKYVLDCIDTNWVSSEGEYVRRFEQALADYTGAAAAVAVVNGTSALHTALLLANVIAGDEVLTTSLTFVGTANAIAHAGATPHFVDVDAASLALCPQKLHRRLSTIAIKSDGQLLNKLTGKRIAAVMPVHVFGHPAKIAEIVQVANEFGLSVIEDAAEALGSKSGQQHLGTFGEMGVLSFNGNKLITTGGGGAILFKNIETAKKAKHLTTTAKLLHPYRYNHDRVGYNYRMPNINAALGLAQLEVIQGQLEKRLQLYGRYSNEFATCTYGNIFQPTAAAGSNHWLNAFVLNAEFKELRDPIIAACHEMGIFVRPVWELLHTLPMYKNAPQDALGTATDLAAQIINLPSSSSYSARSS